MSIYIWIVSIDKYNDIYIYQSAFHEMELAYRPFKTLSIR